MIRRGFHNDGGLRVVAGCMVAYKEILTALFD